MCKENVLIFGFVQKQLTEWVQCTKIRSKCKENTIVWNFVIVGFVFFFGIARTKKWSRTKRAKKVSQTKKKKPKSNVETIVLYFVIHFVNRTMYTRVPYVCLRPGRCVERECASHSWWNWVTQQLISDKCKGTDCKNNKRLFQLRGFIIPLYI